MRARARDVTPAVLGRLNVTTPRNERRVARARDRQTARGRQLKDATTRRGAFGADDGDARAR